ncbi:MAG: PEP-CTERM sorting domain-containing protein [Planctomycetota bacterium]
MQGGLIGVTASGVILSASSAFAAIAPFTETYDGGVFTVETPTTEDDGTPVLTLENDALTVSVPDDTRTTLTVDVSNAVPATNLKVTQSVEFNIAAVADSVSRLGFVFAANPAPDAGEGPADAIYAYLREPANTRVPNFEIAGFDLDTGFIDDDPDVDDEFDVLSASTTYKLIAAVTFLSEDAILVEMELLDASDVQLDSYAYTIVDADLDEGAITGTSYGLYIRNFDAGSEIVFDNWTVTTEIVPEPATIALLVAAGGVATFRRRR